FRTELKIPGPTEILTRIAGFKVQSANHYTIEPSGHGVTCPEKYDAFKALPVAVLLSSHVRIYRCYIDIVSFSRRFCPKRRTRERTCRCKLEGGVEHLAHFALNSHYYVLPMSELLSTD